MARLITIDQIAAAEVRGPRGVQPAAVMAQIDVATTVIVSAACGSRQSGPSSRATRRRSDRYPERPPVDDAPGEIDVVVAPSAVADESVIARGVALPVARRRTLVGVPVVGAPVVVCIWMSVVPVRRSSPTVRSGHGVVVLLSGRSDRRLREDPASPVRGTLPATTGSNVGPM